MQLTVLWEPILVVRDVPMIGFCLTLNLKLLVSGMFKRENLEFCT